MKRLPWCDARYVRLYCDDHPDWVTLSFEAQGLYALLRRRADRSGLLPLGIDGLVGLSGLIGHSAIADRLEPFLRELIRKGFLELHGDAVLIPEFIESENALASPISRKRKEREKRRDLARLSPPQPVDGHDSMSRQHVTRIVTSRDTDAHVTPGRHADGHDSTSRQDVTLMVTTARHVSGHADGHDRMSLSSQLISTDQIPPNPPTVGSSGVDDGSEDPNVRDIRQKLAKQSKPLCFLVATRAEERLYAAVLSGSLTTEHVLAAIDDAALTLGPELGAVQRDDAPGLASVERYVAGCVKRARRDRRSDQTPQSSTQFVSRHSSAPASALPPEVHEAYLAFQDAYIRGGYERFIAASDDERHIADALQETAKHTTDTRDATDVLCDAAKAYFADEFYAGQGHSLKRFALVLKTEPSRLLGKRKIVKSQVDIDNELRAQRVVRDMQEVLNPGPAPVYEMPPPEIMEMLARNRAARA